MVIDAKQFAKTMKARAPHVDVQCEELGTVRLARLSAKAGLKLGKHYAAVPKGPDGQPQSDEAIADFYVWLLSLSIVDTEGEAFLCSDEGRQQIALLSIGTLTSLGNDAMVLNGMAETAKKKKRGTSTTPTTDSPST